MIVYPFGPATDTINFSDIAGAIARAPKSGDTGHTDDHARLVQLMFDITQWEIPVGIAMKMDGEWSLGRTDGGQPAPATFDDVLAFAALPGVRAVGFDEEEFADGTTDHVSDSPIFDNAMIHFQASGVVGLSYAVENSLTRFGAINDRLAALEAAQA